MANQNLMITWPLKPRPCLKCDLIFVLEHRFNRICPRCTAQNEELCRGVLFDLTDLPTSRLDKIIKRNYGDTKHTENL